MDTKVMLETGDKVATGNYACCSCKSTDPYSIYIGKDNTELPECPSCGHTYWIKF